jgi:hypothetical protein
MPSTNIRHARHRDRLAMAGPAIPSQMAKWIPKMIPMRGCIEDLQASKKKRKYCCRREFTFMKRWVTGEKAGMDSEDIERELFELAHD